MIILYGGTERQIREQLDCDHVWHGPCIDDVSRFNKCLKCLCLERDCMSEEEYYNIYRASTEHARTQRGDVWYHYAIFDHPKDYPNHYVVRRFAITKDSDRPKPEAQPTGVCETIEEARKLIPAGLVWFPNQTGREDPVILETWI